MDVSLVALKLGVGSWVTVSLETDVVSVSDAVTSTEPVAVSGLVSVRRLLLCSSDREIVSDTDAEKEGAWYVFVFEGEGESVFDSVVDGDDTCDSLSVGVCVSITVVLIDFVMDRSSVPDIEIVFKGESEKVAPVRVLVGIRRLFVELGSSEFEGVSELPSVWLNDRVFWSVSVWVSVPVDVLVKSSDSDSVIDHCSGVFEVVREIPSVWLNDCVFWSVSVWVSVPVDVLVKSSDSDSVIDHCSGVLEDVSE